MSSKNFFIHKLWQLSLNFLKGTYSSIYRSQDEKTTGRDTES